MRKLMLVALIGLAVTGCSKDRVFWDDNGKLEQKTENREIWDDNGKMDSGERKFWDNAEGEPVFK